MANSRTEASGNSPDRAPRDWNRSWSVTTVDEPAWAALRESLRDRFEELARAIEEQAPADDESLATTMAAIAHAAYHLGAIRQRLAMAGTPPSLRPSRQRTGRGNQRAISSIAAARRSSVIRVGEYLRTTPLRSTKTNVGVAETP